MLPYLLGGLGALGLLGSGFLRRSSGGDARHAQTRRMRRVGDPRRAKTLRMARVNPGYRDKLDELNTLLNTQALMAGNAKSAKGRARMKRLYASTLKKQQAEAKRLGLTNPKRGRKGKWMPPGAAAARLARWRWHHNPREDGTMTESEYVSMVEAWPRKEILKVARAAGLSMNKIDSSHDLARRLWLRIGQYAKPRPKLNPKKARKAKKTVKRRRVKLKGKWKTITTITRTTKKTKTNPKKRRR